MSPYQKVNFKSNFHEMRFTFSRPVFVIVKTLVYSFSAVLDVACGGHSAARRGFTAFSTLQLASERRSTENVKVLLEGVKWGKYIFFFFSLFFESIHWKNEKAKKKLVQVHGKPNPYRQIKQERYALTRHFPTA